MELEADLLELRNLSSSLNFLEGCIPHAPILFNHNFSCSQQPAKLNWRKLNASSSANKAIYFIAVGLKGVFHVKFLGGGQLVVFPNQVPSPGCQCEKAGVQ